VTFFDAMDGAIAPVVRGLEYRTRRHEAIASNIANADTPGYRAVDLTFGRALEGAGLALRTTDPRHLSRARVPARDQVVLSGGEPRRDANDVNVDREMSQLARNQIEYQFLSRALAGQFRRLKDAITGRASA
jgi:flagellar basal-body rod protein FlgB